MTEARLGECSATHPERNAAEPRQGYDRDVTLAKLKRLFGRKRAPQAATKSHDGSPEELERDVDLLERVAAGIALNKTPGR
jgi:hypothetical protein